MSDGEHFGAAREARMIAARDRACTTRRDRELERLAGCECDMSMPVTDTCSRFSWIRCNGRLDYLKKHGLL